MPELPEVEVVRRGLEPYTDSWVIRDVTVFDPRALTRHPGPVEDFVDTLTGRRLVAAVRRGKFLWFPLSDDLDQPQALLCHLGMSGQMLLGTDIEQFGPLLRVALQLESNSGETMIIGFVDQRLFGSLAIDSLIEDTPGVPAGRGAEDSRLPAQVRKIARDPLDPHFDATRFSKALRRKNTGIKRALLDQHLISGVGNIYADEALWRSRLHYEYPTRRLSPARVTELLGHLRDVFLSALEDGGTSFDWQYVNVNGQSGYFSQSLNAYGQDGQPCGRCGQVIVREPFMNRSSFRCPACQRRPAKRVG